ncbi:MAG: HDOD domain-containing protein [Gammaproteobacteria bacterium]|nr:HDOD domain-containing protein [Gammaproteobacteria bacterium]
MTRNQIVQKLLANVESMVSPPRVYFKLRAALDNPTTDFDDLAGLISADVSIAARLLKLANSAMFNFPSQVNSIDRALSLIGTQQTAELILATEVLQTFGGIQSDVISVEDFTAHSLGCAISSRVLAQYKNEHDVEAHFLNGLLHDMGRLLLIAKFPVVQETLITTSHSENIPLRVLETQQYGISHGELGAHLFDIWELPPEVAASAKFYHDPLTSPDHSYTAALCHVANWIAHSIPIGFSGETLVPALDENAWLLVGIPESSLEMIMEEISSQFTSAIKLLQ